MRHVAIAAALGLFGWVAFAGGQHPDKAAFTCPVTPPDPEVELPESVKDQIFGWRDRYIANEALVTTVPPEGRVEIVPENATEEGLWDKWGWYRLLDGQLQITGHRLDAEDAPLDAHVPEGYGPNGFQSSGLLFPQAGCWQVEGRLGEHVLTFVVDVVAPE